MLWYWHPDCLITQDGTTIKTTNPKENLAVVPIENPVGNQKMKVRFVKGQEQPEIQGWYSPEYNVYTSQHHLHLQHHYHAGPDFCMATAPHRRPNIPCKRQTVGGKCGGVEVEVSTNVKPQRMMVPYRDSGKVVVGQ